MSYTETDVDTLARTIFGEARGEALNGQIAVAWVIRNRADSPSWWGGPSVESVCRKPSQFSCWNANDPNLPLMRAASLTDSHFLTAYGVAALVIVRQLPDPTGGATHYLADWLSPKPDWASKLVPTIKIGAHQFYREP